jgi:hypothetical protein
LRFCCSLFHVSRKDFVVDGGVIAGFCFGGVDICIIEAIEALRLTGVVFSAPEEVLGRVIVNRSNSAASDECVQPNISASLDARGSQGVGLVTYTACPQVFKEIQGNGPFQQARKHFAVPQYLHQQQTLKVSP